MRRLPHAPTVVPAVVPALVLALVLGVVASVLVAAPSAHAAAVISSDPARFDAYPGLTREDFEGSRLASNAVAQCGTTEFTSETSTTCYDAGVLAPGIEYDTPSDVTYGVGVATAGYFGQPSTVLLSYGYVDSLSLRFTRPTEIVGFRLSSSGGATSCGLVVTYLDGSPATSRTVSCPTSPATAWVGIEADRPVAAVILSNDGVEIIDDLAFGLRPTPALVVRAASLNRRLGTATLPVRVSGVGTTTISGPGVRRASLDSARARLLRMPVKARGSAARTLKRTGKVTVRVTVTFRPDLGDAVAATRSVTLRRKRR